MALITTNTCIACGHYEEVGSHENIEWHEFGLCKGCHDSKFVVLCDIKTLDGSKSFETYVNIKNDSYTRGYIKEEYRQEKGKVIIIEPVGDTSDISDEVTYYTSEGRNRFMI